ncbi:MAG: RluA family pseudouridine synthase [Firmicutes bacterium]|nr:RluA family pseudouridine synthase [Bacillota bacterium]
MGAERLDVRLARETGLSRSRVERLIAGGMARVGGLTETKPGRKVLPEDEVAVAVPPPVSMEARPEDLPLTIVYEDAHLAVVNKPCGMVVHPAAGNETGTLVNALLHHLSGLSGIGGTLRPGIVHRLDKDTSGLLLVAKDDAAHLALSAALKAREIRKTYLAVAMGRLPGGVIEAPIARHPRDRKRMAVVEGGRWARTEYQILENLRGATLLSVNLITGRTHQIRVHMAHIGHPLLGDRVYGGHKASLMAARLMLHAWRIEFAHPVTGEPMRFEVPAPADFTDAFQKLSL